MIRFLGVSAIAAAMSLMACENQQRKVRSTDEVQAPRDTAPLRPSDSFPANPANEDTSAPPADGLPRNQGRTGAGYDTTVRPRITPNDGLGNTTPDTQLPSDPGTAPYDLGVAKSPRDAGMMGGGSDAGMHLDGTMPSTY